MPEASWNPSQATVAISPLQHPVPSRNLKDEKWSQWLERYSMTVQDTDEEKWSQWLERYSMMVQDADEEKWPQWLERDSMKRLA